MSDNIMEKTDADQIPRSVDQAINQALNVTQVILNTAHMAQTDHEKSHYIIAAILLQGFIHQSPHLLPRLYLQYNERDIYFGMLLGTTHTKRHPPFLRVEHRLTDVEPPKMGLERSLERWLNEVIHQTHTHTKIHYYYPYGVLCGYLDDQDWKLYHRIEDHNTLSMLWQNQNQRLNIVYELGVLKQIGHIPR